MPYFFSAVVEHNGFSAAARAIGVEKTRLSRRVANLEKRLGVRLLHRSTRTMALTEAGERFYERCVAAVEGAQAAYESIADLRKEPAGTASVSFVCSVHHPLRLTAAPLLPLQEPPPDRLLRRHRGRRGEPLRRARWCGCARS